MKAEFVEERDNPRNPNPHHPLPLPPNMFSKFQQPPPLHHPHPLYLQHHDPNPYHYAKESQTSEEADSAAAAAATPTPPSKKLKTFARSDDAGGETIEAGRRPRGRPPGSKNKPKPAVVITREAEAPSMSPYILEIPSGADVVESLVRLTRRRGIGLCVLSGSGAVANATLRQNSNTGGTVIFHGRFDLASISAVILPGGNILGGAFTITLSAPQSHIVGGKVVGPLVAAGTVYIVAAAFNNPTFHKLPLGDEESGDVDVGAGGEQVSSPAVSGGGEGMYSCHVGEAQPQPDVIWAPTARPPHQHPPPPY